MDPSCRVTVGRLNAHCVCSCSLACTRTHKIYCAPKAPKTSQAVAYQATDTRPLPDEANGQAVDDGHNSNSQKLASQIKDLFEQCPPLRDQLKDIYKATLEEQWVEGPVHKDRPRHFGKSRPPPRSRGPWTREKGFKRGLGKVRKYREQCEDSLETGKCAERFMRLLTLVNEGPQQEPQ